MRRLAVVAAMMAVLAAPVGAQHRGGGASGHGGGFSGHVGGAVGHAGAPVNRMGGFSRPGMMRVPFGARGVPMRRPGIGPMYRPGAFDHHGPRMPYRPRYRGGYSGVGVFPYWAAYPYVSPYVLGYPDSFDDEGDNAQIAPYADYGQTPGNGQDPGGQESYPPWPYGGQTPTAAQAGSGRMPYTGGSLATPESTVTIVFKDGRAPERIHNYMLNATTLTVLDGPYRQIPLNEIDEAATVSTNRLLGVEFEFE